MSTNLFRIVHLHTSQMQKFVHLKKLHFYSSILYLYKHHRILLSNCGVLRDDVLCAYPFARTAAWHKQRGKI